MALNVEVCVVIKCVSFKVSEIKISQLFDINIGSQLKYLKIERRVVVSEK